MIGDFHVVSVGLSPLKAKPRLVVDSYAVLSQATSFERFHPISGHRRECAESGGRVEHLQLPDRNLRKTLKPRHSSPVPERFSVRGTEGSDRHDHKHTTHTVTLKSRTPRRRKQSARLMRE
jgi:hypothetical protein